MTHPLTDKKLKELFWDHAVDTGVGYDWTSDGMRAAYDLGWENAKKQDWTYSRLAFKQGIEKAREQIDNFYNDLYEEEQ